MSAPQTPAGRKPRPPVAGRPRTGSRVAAIQALFQSEQSGEAAEAVIDQFVRYRIGPDAGGFEDGRVPLADVPLFASVVRGVARQPDGLDEIVQGHLAGEWTVARLDPVLRALLRAAAYELSSGTEPPARVVINEYMDIAHGFFSGEEPRFANGVLDAMARALRPTEFQR
ncbi:transcription antitermination factor NusB [Roseomonas sp. GC11]|uniref:transcription antitermination factor NusB n=1 Tax=Roseomonas sp. GC11 TaxID=2950546 RepID=UPI00210921FA|nr:transcription antitermination factor NusB [Roseomonas sp. GC11]MCQ4158961.1 transcription antitermination factor NusB [Roseomonas sp. GC11]